ncbi:hypothetical protein EIP91_009959 [Steccherinum ochraceum]|uniref:Uncharacterized protein n=1 Tax=Steccherinum ochraceum TaxID=92696 RepID=A0A4R0R3A6_9APHY|nr:hypothetical protein EIP91_009959 [Steccherinum ochraceum]
MDQHESRIDRYALSPIARLPPEVLGRIFVVYSQREMASVQTYRVNPFETRSTFPYKWIVVTHICSHWREIALGTPELWTTIRLGLVRPEVIEVFLSRSKHALLRVDGKEHIPTRTISAFKPFLHAIARAESLSLQMSAEVYDTLASEIPSSAPHLRTLEVTGTTPETATRSLLERLSAPSLIRLSLSHCTPSLLESSFPASLKHLSLIFPMGHEVSVDDAIFALKDLSALEELVLFGLDHQRRTSNSRGARKQPILLPRLQKLRLKASTLWSIQFLERVTLPASTTISLLLRDAPTANAIRGLGPSLAHILSTRIGLQDDREAVELVKVIPKGVLFFKRSSLVLEPSLEIRLPASYNPPQILGDLLSVLDPTLLRHATALTFEGISYDYPEAWEAFLRSMGNVEELNIHASSQGPYHSEIINLIGSCFDHNAEEREFPFPNLKRITFHNVKFRELDDEDTHFYFVDGLYMAVVARGDFGSCADIEEIHIKDCLNMNDYHVRSLEKFVETVKWDGVKYYEVGVIEDEAEHYESDDENWDADEDEEAEDEDEEDEGDSEEDVSETE